MDISIPPREINASAPIVFDFLTNMDNYQTLMPDSVTKWQSEKETCTFSVQNTFTIGMQIAKKKSPETILIQNNGETSMDFSLALSIESLDIKSCQLRIQFEGKAPNPFIKMMMQNQLGAFFGYFSKSIQQHFAQA